MRTTGKIVIRQCQICGKDILGNVRNAKVCSGECKAIYKGNYKKEINARKRALTRMMLGTKECAICSKVFEPRNSRQVTCSRECQKIRDNGTMATWRFESNKSIKPEIKQPKQKKAASLAEINRKARELGMSYGQYMAYLATKGE